MFDTELVHISDEPLATTEGYDETYQQFGEGEEFGASEQVSQRVCTFVCDLCFCSPFWNGIIFRVMMSPFKG